MTIEQYLLVGDSLTTGLVAATSIGEKGCWAELVAESLCSLRNKPLLGPGIRGFWIRLPGGTPEWGLTGTWTQTGLTVADAKAPYGASYTNANGDIATWAWPTRWRPIVSFCLYWIDTTAGGNWQYRIDGGTWTNMGQTLAHDHSLNKFYVNTPVATSVEVRSNDGAGNVSCTLVGIEPFFANPLTVDGIIFQNIAVSGTRLRTLMSTTGGADMCAFVDNVKLGSGSPPSNTPNAGALVMHLNDVELANTSQWASDLTAFYNRVSPRGPVMFHSPHEAVLATFPQADQAAYRAQTKTTAAGLGAGVPVLDHYDAWTALGIVGNAAMSAAGLLIADAVHPTPYAHRVMWPRVFAQVRRSFLAGIDGPRRYPVTGKAAASVFTGTRPVQVPAAGSPLAVTTLA